MFLSYFKYDPILILAVHEFIMSLRKMLWPYFVYERVFRWAQNECIPAYNSLHPGRTPQPNSMKCTGSIVSVYCFSAALSDWMCVILETGFSFMLRLDSIHDHWELAFANLCATVWAQPSCGFIASQASKPLGRLPTVCLGFGIFKQQ